MENKNVDDYESAEEFRKDNFKDDGYMWHALVNGDITQEVYDVFEKYRNGEISEAEYERLVEEF